MDKVDKDLKIKQMLDRKIYVLSGEDVKSTLEDMDLGHVMLDEEKIENLMDYIDRKLDIPWSDYLEICIDAYNERYDHVLDSKKED